MTGPWQTINKTKKQIKKNSNKQTNPHNKHPRKPNQKLNNNNPNSLLQVSTKGTNQYGDCN